ncbi:hypothetical protein [Oceanicoccus sp. KOV_DT_Chl]|uniref:hypothetical protein n=1 Tax=Oceanicoccus sp. KOV_DT_Chl TaxID=1904639 RepID=UPI001F2A9FD2|nr:hypothetical protein [Oceanicoccus sp. KOV_DT_Chl]
MTEMTETNVIHKPSIMDVFVQRPVLSIVISLALVLIGVRAAMSLPVLEFPRIESAALIINTRLLAHLLKWLRGLSLNLLSELPPQCPVSILSTRILQRA